MTTSTDFNFMTPASLTIFDVRRLEDALQNCMTSGQLFHLNLQDITELDSAGVQWLMSLKQRPEVVSRISADFQPNDVCTEQFRLMGLNDFFGGIDD